MRNFDIAFCGRKLYTDYAQKFGWLVGCRSDLLTNNAYSDDDKIDFIDCPFKDWEAHKERYWEVISHYKPAIAIAPDIYSWNEFKEKIDYAYRILELGIKTIVVPKVKGMARQVPSDFVIGFPMGNKAYSDVTTSEWELFSVQGRPIHLLGGTPRRLTGFINYHNVVSVDWNAFVKAAMRYRRAYGPNLESIDMRGNHHADEIVFKSIEGIATYWNNFKKRGGFQDVRT